jgi:hypothetical protein
VPFYREYDPVEEAYFINRGRTGPSVVPQPGVVQTNTGIVVGADTNVVGQTNVILQPDVAVKVTMPGPREPVIDARGVMAPRWRRFFEELYRRTGALEDNVNAAEFALAGSGVSTTGSLAFTGAAPTVNITHIRGMSLGSATLTGQDVTITNTS